MDTQDFSIVNKEVGETPLQALEQFRTDAGISADTPLAYAGRLDPMASGKLLILIGEECKHQDKYFGLDKEYEFEVLFGVSSDTADVLGLITPSSRKDLELDDIMIEMVCEKLVGQVELPYPHFSSKTVQGKPLHVWTLEGRLDEITIPTKQSEIHKLELLKTFNLTKDEIYHNATQKIETIPPVTDPSKALGNDFRRPLVRESWKNWLNNSSPRQGLGLEENNFIVAKFRCVASSGTYMRTLAEVIARELGTTGLAYSIHRTKIGKYKKLPLIGGVWLKKF